MFTCQDISFLHLFEFILYCVSIVFITNDDISVTIWVKRVHEVQNILEFGISTFCLNVIMCSSRHGLHRLVMKLSDRSIQSRPPTPEEFISSHQCEILVFLCSHYKHLALFPSWEVVLKQLPLRFLWDLYNTAFFWQNFCWMGSCLFFWRILHLRWSCFSISHGTDHDVLIFWWVTLVLLEHALDETELVYVKFDTLPLESNHELMLRMTLLIQKNNLTPDAFIIHMSVRFQTFAPHLVLLSSSRGLGSVGYRWYCIHLSTVFE